MYDIKDHAYAKFRLGHVFVRVEPATQVVLTSMADVSYKCTKVCMWLLHKRYCNNSP